MGFQRAARTDKGVSAAGQVVSLKISLLSSLSCSHHHLDQGCTTCGLRAGSGPQRCYIRPSEQVKKYKKLLLNDGDVMNEFKLH